MACAHRKRSVNSRDRYYHLLPPPRTVTGRTPARERGTGDLVVCVSGLTFETPRGSPSRALGEGVPVSLAPLAALVTCPWEESAARGGTSPPAPAPHSRYCGLIKNHPQLQFFPGVPPVFPEGGWRHLETLIKPQRGWQGEESVSLSPGVHGRWALGHRPLGRGRPPGCPGIALGGLASSVLPG